MERDSFVFYQSFWRWTKHLPKDNQKNALVMMVEYWIDWIEPTPETDPIAYAMFLMAKPQIDKNNQRYISWLSGWRPKKDWENSQKPKDNHTITKPKPNVNDNVNDNVISKDNIIYTPKNNFDYSFVDEFLNKDNPIIKYQIQKEWLDIYLWKQYEVVDKLIKDWFTLEQIQLSCLFIKQDDFWKNNILTIKKLRQKNKDWVPYIVVILWKAKDFIEEKQNRTYQKTFLYGDWQNYVSN